MKGLQKLFFVLSIVLLVNSHVSAQDKLIQDVTILSHDSLEGREIGTVGELKAARYIANRFADIGLSKAPHEDSFFQVFTKRLRAHPHDTLFTGKEVTGRNVLAYIDNSAEKTIVVGAHYDHLGWGGSGSLHTGDPAIHNGADDNASGVAALLSIAAALKKQKLSHNVLFIAFTGEEKGLLGSNYFINHLSSQPEELHFMINMDMIGRLDTARRLAVYGVGTSPSFIPALESVPDQNFAFKLDSSGLGPSDHTSFYLNNVPVLHFFTGQHAQYHKPEDDVELINFAGLNDVITFISDLIFTLDKEESIAFTKTKDKKKGGKERSFKVTLGIIPDYLFDGIGLKIDGTKPNRPADKAGLQKGDIILQLGDIKTNTMHDYVKVLGMHEKGDEVSIVYLRGTKTISSIVLFD